MRTLIKDVVYAVCFTVVVVLIILHGGQVALWEVGLAYGILAGKDVVGKRIQGEQEIRKRGGGG